MTPVTAQWRCRLCDFDRYHQVTVLKKNGARYETSFYACSHCSVLFMNPAQFNKHGAPALEALNVVRMPARR